MWINSPLGRWEMKERTRRIRAPQELGGWQELGRWRREVEDARKAQRGLRPAGALAGFVLALGQWFGLSGAKLAS
jgi:hypothetical protein